MPGGDERVFHMRGLCNLQHRDVHAGFCVRAAWAGAFVPGLRLHPQADPGST